MSDTAAVVFRTGTEDAGFQTSVAFITQSDGPAFQNLAVLYALQLISDVVAAKARTDEPGPTSKIGDIILARGPLGNFEPSTVMVDFIRWYLVEEQSLGDKGDRVDSNYRLDAADGFDATNCENGITTVDLTALSQMDEMERSLAVLMMT